jgi:hypothetical protein
MQFEIKNRFTGAVQFTAEIDATDDTPLSLKIGLSVKWAIKTRANLAGAYLTGADLAGADLAGADLAGANLARANLAGADLADAYLAGAHLAGAYLTGAYLTGARLAGADLAGANLVDGGQRSDGYRFVGWVKGGVLQIRAGCRNFAIAEAREHWTKTRGGTPLGDETMCILDHIEAVTRIRGLIPAREVK